MGSQDLGETEDALRTDACSSTAGETLLLSQAAVVKFSLGFPETVRPLWEAEVEPVSGAFWLQIEAEINVLQRKFSPV